MFFHLLFLLFLLLFSGYKPFTWQIAGCLKMAENAADIFITQFMSHRGMNHHYKRINAYDVNSVLYEVPEFA